jgi:Fe2+ or Zn2+ uptake regulation protein
VSKKPYRTAHQRELMGIVLQAAGEGRQLNVTEIHALITYGASYGAVRKTLATLVEQQMLVRQRRGFGNILVPTQKGYDWFRPART